MALAVVTAFALSGCNSYDEEDITIVGYLKVNDLLEQKIRSTCEKDIEKFEANMVLQFLDIGYIDYDEDIVNTFYDEFFVDDKVDLEKLEQAIANELWEYLNTNYTNAIPSKAQNINEGRYYTIEELRAKYPDYRDLEIEDFSPMELINSVMREDLFELSFISNDDVNLKTLYTYYLYYTTSEQSRTSHQQNELSDDNYSSTANTSNEIVGGYEEEPATVVVWFKSGKHTIKIEPVGNENYRYSCWDEPKLTSDEPTIVLIGNATSFGYCFFNQSYRYEVDTDREELRVYKGNELLSKSQCESFQNAAQ